jgi:hypothetical protein
MVGKRTWANGASPQKDTTRRRKPPLERQGTHPKPPRLLRYSDSDALAIEDQAREDVKDTLLKAVNSEKGEKYRKSDEELKAIGDKKIKRFYERQNDKLNDWLEVDAIVTALADDVLESFNPDPDFDGIPGAFDLAYFSLNLLIRNRASGCIAKYRRGCRSLSS